MLGAPSALMCNAVKRATSTKAAGISGRDVAEQVERLSLEIYDKANEYECKSNEESAECPNEQRQVRRYRPEPRFANCGGRLNGVTFRNEKEP